VVLSLFLLAPARPAFGGDSRRLVSGAHLAKLAQAGRPVFVVHARIQGRVRLPRIVRAPLVIRNSHFAGAFDAADAEFQGMVDLSGDRFGKSADFAGARFDAPFVFRHVTAAHARFDFGRFTDVSLFTGAVFNGSTSFAAAEFSGPARFIGATFNGPSFFSSSSFLRRVDFEAASFKRAVSFALAEFESHADFTAAQLVGTSRFDGVRFSRAPDFKGTQFGPDQPRSGRPVLCANGNYVWTTFCNARLEQGADFVGASFRGVSFSGASAVGSLDFTAAQFRGSPDCVAGTPEASATGIADFSTTTFVGQLSFTNADFDCLANFDQARIDDLDLSGATLQRLWFPRQGNPSPTQQLGHIGALHLSVRDVSKIEAPPSSGARARRRELEGVLQLVENGARAGDDLSTANEARVRRLSLVRASRPPPMRLLDWAVWWGLLGYLVRPWHQAIVIAIVLFAGLTARLLAVNLGQVSAAAAPGAGGIRSSSRRLGHRFRIDSRRLRPAFNDLLGVLFRLRPPTEGGWRLFEYLLLKFLIVVLAINVGNVWPAFRTLVEGVF
jgi:uncharacterized protein YjbI with pentapeptide repeats